MLSFADVFNVKSSPFFISSRSIFYKAIGFQIIFELIQIVPFLEENVHEVKNRSN